MKKQISISLWIFPFSFFSSFSPFSKLYIKFEFLENTFENGEKREKREKRKKQTIFGKGTEFRLRRCDPYYKWCKVGGVSRYIETVQIIYFFEYPSFTLGSFNASK